MKNKREGGNNMKTYGVLNFIGDLILVGITGGAWLIWIFIREMRRGK